jgi:hypothetical protein
MDDGGRCLLDVIDDPQLLQSFLENTNGAIERLETNTNTNNDNQQHKALAAVKTSETNNTINKIPSNISSIAAVLADSKQVDHVTSSAGNISPISTVHKQPSAGFIIDEKQTLNMVSSSVGLIPLSAFSNATTAASISFSQPSLTTLTNTSPVSQITSTVPFRAPTANPWPPTSFQIAAPRSGGALTVQLPQQLIVPAGAMQMTQTAGGLSQFVLTSPRAGGPHAAQLPPGIQPGQLVQIIQTPNGTQILPTNQTANIQQIVTTSCTTKSSSTTSSSRSNKQILPKPPGSTVSTNNSVTTNAVNKCGQVSQQNTLKVINSLQHATNATQFATTSIPTSGAATPATQQILIGPTGQPAGVIAAGPQGTFLLNHLIPGIGPQPILIQGNLGNVPTSVQLTLRPQSHTSPVMTMSSITGANISTHEQNAGLMNAFTANQATTGAKSQPPSQSPQPQTYVIPNHSQAVSSAPPGVMMTTGGRGAPNFILTRPPLIGAQHQTQPTGQQFLQIQTPNGPVLVALQTHPQMSTTQMSVGPQMSNSSVATQPTHSIQLGNTMIPIGAQHLPSQMAPNLNASLQTSAHPALHALLTTHTDSANGQTVIQSGVPSVPTSNTVILTSQPQIITRPQIQSQSQTTTSFVVSGQQQSKNAAPSVNLAELLKEHGILPESSPPSSPINNSMTDISGGGVHSELMHTPTSQQTVLMVPSGPNQAPNLVLTQTPVTPTAPPQLRLALGPDGSVILHPHIATNANNLLQQQIQSQYVSNSRTYNESLKDTSGLGSSQPSPDSTTPSIDSTSTTPSTVTVSQQNTTTTSTAPTIQTQNTSALLEQLNTAPAVKVPDLVASLALQHGSASNANNATEESKPQQTALIPLTVQNINNNVVEQQQKPTILTIPVQNGENSVSNVSSNAVIRIGNCCDTIPTSLVLTTTPTTVFASPSKGPTTGTITVLSPSNGTNHTNNSSVSGTATTVIDQNGVPMIQVSPNNQEFLQRLETQLKSLLALKSPTNQQKELLQELLSLQQKMIQARVQSQNASEDQKVVLTTANQINLSPQTQQVLQTQQQQSQPQNVHLVNLLKQTPVNQTSAPQIRLLTPASTAPVSATTTIQVGNQIITFTTPAKQQLQNLKTIATNQTPQTNQTVLKVLIILN